MVTLGDQRIAFEARFSSAPKPGKGFWKACKDLKAQAGYVIAPGQGRYPIAATTRVMPIQDIASVLAA